MRFTQPSANLLGASDATGSGVEAEADAACEDDERQVGLASVPALEVGGGHRAGPRAGAVTARSQMREYLNSQNSRQIDQKL